MNLNKNWFSLLISIIFSLLFSIALSQFLQQHEVEILQTIFDKLHAKDWNISRSFCNSSSMLNVTVNKGILTNITCGRIGSVYHVTNIQLKGQNLTGTLPADFANQSYLREMFLNSNSMSGAVPDWVFNSKDNMQLPTLSFCF